MQVKQRLRINIIVMILSAVALLVMLLGTMYSVNRAMEAKKIADMIVTTAFERLALRTDYMRTGSDRARQQVSAKFRQISGLLRSASATFTSAEDRKTVTALIESNESADKVFRAIIENRNKVRPKSGPGDLSLEVEDRLLSQLNMRVYETVILAGKLQESTHDALFARLALAGGGIAFVFLLAGAATVINSSAMNRAITSRIARLRQGSSLIGGGDLDHSIELRGNDEFADLAHDFNVMTANLKASYNSLEKEIEERRRAEEETRKLTETVQQEKDKLSSLVSSITDEVWFADQQKKFTLANPSALRSFGFDTVDDVDIEKFAASLEVFHPDGSLRPIEEAPPLRALRGEVVTNQEEIIRTPAAGELRYRQVSSAPVRDANGNIIGSVSVVRDITQLKRAEETLREKETYEKVIEATRAERQRFLDMLDTLPVIIDIIRADHKIEWTNRAYREALGNNEGRLCFESQFGLDKPCKECQAFTPLTTGKPHNWEWTLPSGRTFDIHNFPFAAADGSPAVLEMDIDITERKRAEAEIQEAQQVLSEVNKTLELKVAERTSELESANMLLRDSRRAALNMMEDALAARRQAEQTSTELTREITDRKRAEERLSLQREELQAILDSVPASIFYKDNENRFLRVNLAFSKLMDMPRDQLEGSSLYDLYPKEMAEAYFRDDLEVIGSGKPKMNIIEPVQIKTGRRWVQTDKIPYRDGQGNFIGVIGFSVDITERRQAEAELIRLNKVLKALSDSSQAAIRSKDEKEYLDEVCKIIIEDCGYKMTWIGLAEHDEAKSVRPVAYSGFEEGYLETLKLTWADSERGRGPTGTAIRTGKISTCRNMLTDPAFTPWRQEAIKRGYASSIVFPLRIDGDVFGAITIYSKEPDPFSEGEVKFLAELSDNLSYGVKVMRIRVAQQQADEALRQSLSRFELLSATAGELLLTTDPQKVVESVCRKVMEYLDCHAFFNFLVDEQAGKLHLNAYAGIPEEETRRIEWLDFGVAVCGCAARDAERIIAEHIPTTPDERTQLIRSFGIKAYCCHPLLGPGGKVIGTLSFGTCSRQTFSEEDISLMKAVTDQVTVAMIRMRNEADVLKLGEDMAARNVELESVNKELESFIYSISHDLRAPLRTMGGFARMMVEDYTDRLDEKGRDYLGRIRNGSEKMTRLIDDLLNLAKISRQELNRMKIDLSKLSSSVVSELQEADPARNVEVLIAEGLTAFADRRLIEIVLSNLIGNAWKFTSHTENARIEFGVTNEDGKKVFFIKDNGAGFNPQYIDKMFWPFQRLHSDKEFPGTGIGLTIVERIIHRHGGKVWAEGEVGKGATIFFTLDQGDKSPS